MSNDAPYLIKSKLPIITLINEPDLINKYPGILMLLQHLFLLKVKKKYCKKHNENVNLVTFSM